ncbi:chorismate-binding protein [Advenella sp. RU8]|uniref:bifunctional chorismate-binding protein/class IV aminotransferase n=1 Tax=Advenella sp. RU8 TaxID=3399575 RepID=UPI003AB071C0
MQSPFFVFLDDAVAQTGTLHEHLVHTDNLKADALEHLQRHLQQGWQKNWHAIVWAPYGLGQDIMGLEKTALPSTANLPQTPHALQIFWFAQKTRLNNNEAIQDWLNARFNPEEPAGLLQPSIEQNKADYLESIEQIREDIAAGEVYQINYTTQLNFQAYGSPVRLYQKLRAKQPVPYGALACLPATAGNAMTGNADWTLCFSPELFLDIRNDGCIHTEPMKGTVPAFDDGQNEARAKALRADPKNRAENVMIVDLLRNDLSKIAIPNGVKVPELFSVTPFGPVLQMTTPIYAQAKPGTNAGDIFQALFPCGSITGAPKKRSMQLIEKYEQRDRGLYTGSIGYLEPCEGALGFCGKLNVVIRTLELTAPVNGQAPANATPTAQQFTGRMGVGSGIVHDSTAESEYEECHWKYRFLQNLPQDFTLFETMLFNQGTCSLLEAHLRRLKRSAAELGFTFNEDSVRQTLNSHFTQLLEHDIKTGHPQAYRIKVSLHGNGSLAVQHAVLEPLSQEAQSVIIAPRPFPNRDILRRYKTSHRQHYDEQMHRAMQLGAFDSLCFNQDGHLLEGARSSIFIYHQGQWLTPPLEMDILRSVMREQIMQNPSLWLSAYTPANERPGRATITLTEQAITRKMIENAPIILAVNALRGLMPVKLLHLKDFNTW